MLEQLTGAVAAVVLVLAYVLVVQCMTAAAVLLCEFIVLRVRALAALVAEQQSRPGESYRGDLNDSPPTAPSYRLGGDVKW
jgi:hypothetical protein